MATLPFKLIYHEDYDLNLGSHVFPSQKFRLIREKLLADGFASEDDFARPEAATDDDVRRVHTEAWVDALRQGTLTHQQIARLEIPYSPEMVRAFRMAAGGSILAGRCALRDGAAFNCGGGFHHAFPSHGEGFCAIHDVAVAIRALSADGAIRKALVVDCDVHQGNGTAAIFAGDNSVFTISLHQYANYPYEKPPSNIDVHLADGTGDDEYLTRLSGAYLPAVGIFQPEIVFYVAGADPYYDDQLGGLALTLDGLRERDRVVFNGLRVPVAVTLAGGYARNLSDTVLIQSNTAKMIREVMG